MYREADGADEMRKAVREQLRRGADYIKLMATGARSVLVEDPEPAQMTRDELAAIVDEAHGSVSAWPPTSRGSGRSSRRPRGRRHDRAWPVAPSRACAARRMAERGIVLVPTLSTFHDLAERFTDDFPPALVEQAKRQREEAYATLMAARAAGVTLAMGHDSGPPGENAIELARMVSGGLSALEGIAAATRGSALALGLSDVGTVTAGAPTCSWSTATRSRTSAVLCDPERIWMVVQGGRAVAGEGMASTTRSPDSAGRLPGGKRAPVGTVRGIPRGVDDGRLHPLARGRAGVRVGGYDELWRWSVDDLAAFWASVATTTRSGAAPTRARSSTTRRCRARPGSRAPS